MTIEQIEAYVLELASRLDGIVANQDTFNNQINALYHRVPDLNAVAAEMKTLEHNVLIRADAVEARITTRESAHIELNAKTNEVIEMTNLLVAKSISGEEATP